MKEWRSDIDIVDVLDVSVSLVVIDDAVHALVLVRVVFFVHLVQACDSRLVVVRNAFAVFVFLLVTPLEVLFVLAMSIAFVVNHQFLQSW